jgi:hypothetical protein
MKELIRIEIQSGGALQVFIAQSQDDAASTRALSLYRALRPQIYELEKAVSIQGGQGVSLKPGR